MSLATQTPIETDRTELICSVTTRTPFSNTSFLTILLSSLAGSL